MIKGHAEKVIIRGHVFDWDEKAPFVTSGVSVLGAIEYDETNDLLRCHECGNWYGDLGNHVSAHGLRAAAYKIKHGLRIQRAGLINMALRESMSARSKKTFEKHGSPVVRQWTERRGPAQKTAYRNTKRRESDNLVGRCDAQLLFRVQVLAAQTGHTPTCAELSGAGINHNTLIARFGSLQAAMTICDLLPNQPGNRARNLPKDFEPSEEKLAQVMPWPKEYFGVRLPRGKSTIAA